MFAVIIIIAMIVSCMLDSEFGKIIIIAAVLAGALALLGLLFHLSFFYLLAKIAVGIIIVVVAIRILVAIFDN